MKENIDFLIVGNGLAGTLCAYDLNRKGYAVRLLSCDLPGAASRIGAGIINPITGMRFVKSWNVEELIEKALNYYSALESVLDTSFITKRKIYQVLQNAEQENQWLSRTADPEYKSWIETNPDVDFNEGPICKPFALGVIYPAYQLDIVHLLTRVLYYLEQKNVVLKAKLDFNDLNIDMDSTTWKQYIVKHKVIFCEGFRIVENPFFCYLPVVKLKGDCIKITMSPASINFIFKSDYSLVPLSADEYWLGSNYNIKNPELQIDSEEIEKQKNFLSNNLNAEYKIVENNYGIRPATRDRRPILGQHPVFSSLAVINGFGTKGASLAPFCVDTCIKSMVEKYSIPKVISIHRFDHLIPSTLRNTPNQENWKGHTFPS